MCAWMPLIAVVIALSGEAHQRLEQIEVKGHVRRTSDWLQSLGFKG